MGEDLDEGKENGLKLIGGKKKVTEVCRYTCASLHEKSLLSLGSTGESTGLYRNMGGTE